MKRRDQIDPPHHHTPPLPHDLSVLGPPLAPLSFATKEGEHLMPLINPYLCFMACFLTIFQI